MPEFIVLRRKGPPTEYATWVEAGTTSASDAGDAFRKLVLDYETETVALGEYMILPLDGAWRVGAEIQLRNLMPKGLDQ